MTPLVLQKMRKGKSVFYRTVNFKLGQGQGRPPCRVLKIPDQRKTNLSEKSALVNLLLCDFWIWFGF